MLEYPPVDHNVNNGTLVNKNISSDEFPVLEAARPEAPPQAPASSSNLPPPFFI